MATTNVREITIALRSDGEGLLNSLVDELSRLAQEAVNFMKRTAPKWRSTLTNSIRADKISDFEWDIGPGVEYAPAVEEGRAPGKGLPRWEDPAAADIVQWLATKVFAGRRRARRTSMKAVHENLELRDRYQGLAWHVRHHGIKAHPFAAPTLDMMERSFPARLELAARRYLATTGSGGAA
ncbi:hypothetical protein KW843_07440 [Acidovorax sp. sif1233]|uniref:hypothetical protein n=1 Tax=Acidovorax sp. sif1233 TaxID=2854792 RepID=UPI001C496E9F|nr:hypothetical protein [Acidovorax sp. sif1233]MBV7454299.1 hypothetical protein [Acidovorax sp. sif1233]